ncbi:MAG: hypothetical protein P1U60_08165 [Hyphomonas sp.]|nr:MULTISPECIES: hypothetical protein [Hyphomonadaceae]MDF1806336.1 hypothetical protein [Hyphomonas sp.]
MIAPIAAALQPHFLAGRCGESLDHFRRDGLMSGAVEHGFGAFRVGFRLITKDFQTGDALFQRRIVEVGDADLDGVVKAFQPQLRFRCPPVQFGDVLTAALSALLPSVEHIDENLFQPIRRQQTLLQMLSNQRIELIHRDCPALAASLALTRLDRAGVVAVTPALASADGHGAAALAAKADPRQQGWSCHYAWRRDLGIARLHQLLHGVEGLAVYDRRNRNRHQVFRLGRLLVLAMLAPLMLADIGPPGQDAMNLSDAPAAAVSREDAPAIEMRGDRFDAHGPARSVPFQGEAIDQPDRVGVQRIDLQFLLGLGAALFGRDHAIADGRARAVPEALAGVFLERAQDVLGVLLGLIFIEQRHDLAHHDVHGIVAHLLGDGDELDAVLGELPDVELQLEMVAEETAE